MIYRLDEVRHLHLEVTSRCNAACPLCARTTDGGSGVLPGLPLTDLTLEWCQTVFPEDFIRQLDRVEFCGTFGDPGVGRDTKEICEWLRSVHPTLEIRISTNGSMRKPEWWADLARILGPEGYVVWGLDGLRDTNHLYRKNTDWSTIMRNVTAFIQAGGRAWWQFIPFAHNEHQIDIAEGIAKTMGFELFYIRRTRKTLKRLAPDVKVTTEVKDRKTHKTTHTLETATSERAKHRIAEEGAKIIQAAGSEADYIKNTVIECKVKARGELYVSADGLIFPCCILGSIHVGNHFTPHLEKWGGKEMLDPLVQTLQGVVEGPIFRNIAASWTGEDRIRKCAVACGKLATVSNHDDYIPLA